MSPFYPLQTLAECQNTVAGALLLVLIHGAFRPRLSFGSELSARGFYTTRWVVTSDEPTAIGKAFDSARRELAREQADIRDGLVTVELEAEEVTPGSWWRWFKGGGRGFAFYTED